MGHDWTTPDCCINRRSRGSIERRYSVLGVCWGLPIPAVVAVRGGDQFAARSNDASGAPDGGATKGFHPPGSAAAQHASGSCRGHRFGSGARGWGCGQGCRRTCAIGCRSGSPDRDAIRSAMRPGPGKDALPRPPALMEGNGLTRAYSHVGGDAPECAPDSMGRNGPVRTGGLRWRPTCLPAGMRRWRAFRDFGFWSPLRFLRHGDRCPTPIRSNRVPPPKTPRAPCAP